jgi:hypothetical protein
MALVMNCTNEEQTFRIVGNWFTFKPKQRKQMQDDIAHLIQTERREFGMAVLPAEFDDPDYERSPETKDAAKEILTKLSDNAVNAYIAHHRTIVANNQISLRRDLEQANIKVDPAVYASPGELHSMGIVAKYARAQKDADNERALEAKKLLAEIEKNS